VPELCLGPESGGDFLGGAVAQEESLAKSSGLHHYLLECPDYCDTIEVISFAVLDRRDGRTFAAFADAFGAAAARA